MYTSGAPLKHGGWESRQNAVPSCGTAGISFEAAVYMHIWHTSRCKTIVCEDGPLRFQLDISTHP